MASSGLEITITKAFEHFSFTLMATSRMILMLIPRRSSRLMPGLRGTPAVTITTSAPATSSYLLVPTIRTSYPSTARDCMMSSALPWGTPSTTSNSTTSPSSFWAARSARLPPI